MHVSSSDEPEIVAKNKGFWYDAIWVMRFAIIKFPLRDTRTGQ